MRASWAGSMTTGGAWTLTLEACRLCAWPCARCEVAKAGAARLARAATVTASRNARLENALIPTLRAPVFAVCAAPARHGRAVLGHPSLISPPKGNYGPDLPP